MRLNIKDWLAEQSKVRERAQRGGGGRRGGGSTQLKVFSVCLEVVRFFRLWWMDRWIIMMAIRMLMVMMMLLLA